MSSSKQHTFDCQLANLDADCEQIATQAPDGSAPYLCGHCEQATRGEGSESRLVGSES